MSLCDSCGTTTAQSVARWLHDPTQESQAGTGSTLERRRQTLSQNLALAAAGWESTGITPTTGTLSALCGSAVAATLGSTLTADRGSETDHLRLRYCPKSSRQERNAGLDGFEEKATRGNYGDGIQDAQPHTPEGYVYEARTKNSHPTVKPISLMRWLVRLVTPPGGTVLDPFAGSGTTGCAAALEGFGFVGIERDPDYVQIARARIAWWDRHRGTGEAAAILAAGEARDELEQAGQGALF